MVALRTRRILGARLKGAAKGVGIGFGRPTGLSGPSSPASNALLWYESNDVTLNGTPAVTAMTDQSPSGLDLGFATPNPWVASGGPNGAPYMKHQQHGIIAGASLVACPATTIQTIYTVGRLDVQHGSGKLFLACDDSASAIQCSTFGQANQVNITSGGKQAFVNITGTPWYAARWRWNLSGSAIKATGIVEQTDATQPLFGGVRFWNFLYTQSGANYDTCLVAVFNEDTLVTGVDTLMQTHILSEYGLSL